MNDLFATLKLLENHIKELSNFECVELFKAKERVLFEDIKAKIDTPRFTNSALDGYAFNYDDKDKPLHIKGTIFAGDKAEYELKPCECYKIMTGAKLPKNADTILMIENECIQKGRLIIKNPPKRLNAVRFKGEEYQQNEPLFQKGTLLTNAHLAVLASQGISELKVYKKLQVGVFSSGNELKEPCQEADENSVYDANATSITAQLTQPSIEISYLGIIKDELNEVKKALANCNYDLLITSGAASVGEADFMQKALKELGFMPIFEGIKAKFIKPSKLFQKDDKLVLVLPGNPLSCFLATRLIVPKLFALLFGTILQDKSYEVLLSKDIELKSGRNNFIFGKLKNGVFTPYAKNFGSNMLKVLLESEYLLISELESSSLTQNQKVKIFKILDF
ncbi:molybdopterin molybdotransferase MoeA [Campylobacter sp. MIT 97-5078]|uniref:molybdopterin molybdotransferase MoeA n=1 Tax=Campylobacter sp. MIT 97-5078 TaxID=1548153 RepID=UPI0005138207|nr:molybdopterin molybdotransferase MoeA [Campylobacter sp. MIT 97-5078]KGI56957.1 molybdopterin biosynthesis protein MoeA [Campylobacter sp. MIT 97-5078]TQR28210.1 molybdopterin molybdenumtransferase MoeA [Campylobacter sp. MIT 97-5078]